MYLSLPRAARYCSSDPQYPNISSWIMGSSSSSNISEASFSISGHIRHSKRARSEISLLACGFEPEVKNTCHVFICLFSYSNWTMSQKSKRSGLRKVGESSLFRFLTERFAPFRREPLGLKWNRGMGYFEVDLPETGVKWIAVLTPKYWLFKPVEKLPGIREIHYNLPYPFGIWFHRTILSEDGKKTRNRLRDARFSGTKYDMAKDYIALRKVLLEST